MLRSGTTGLVRVVFGVLIFQGAITSMVWASAGNDAKDAAQSISHSAQDDTQPSGNLIPKDDFNPVIPGEGKLPSYGPKDLISRPTEDGNADSRNLPMPSSIVGPKGRLINPGETGSGITIPVGPYPLPTGPKSISGRPIDPRVSTPNDYDVRYVPNKDKAEGVKKNYDKDLNLSSVEINYKDGSTLIITPDQETTISPKGKVSTRTYSEVETGPLTWDDAENRHKDEGKGGGGASTQPGPAGMPTPDQGLGGVENQGSPGPVSGPRSRLGEGVGGLLSPDGSGGSSQGPGGNSTDRLGVGDDLKRSHGLEGLEASDMPARRELPMTPEEKGFLEGRDKMHEFFVPGSSPEIISDAVQKHASQDILEGEIGRHLAGQQNEEGIQDLRNTGASVLDQPMRSMSSEDRPMPESGTVDREDLQRFSSSSEPDREDLRERGSQNAQPETPSREPHRSAEPQGQEPHRGR